MALLTIAVLDRHVLVHAEPVHDVGDALPAEPAHQVVFQRDEEARGAGVALAARAAAQLVVDAPRLVALGAQHVQAARLEHLLAVPPRPRPWPRPAPAARPGHPRTAWPGRPPPCAAARAPCRPALPPSRMSTPRPAMLVAMVTVPGRPACAMIAGLPLVLLGVEHVVRHALALEQLRQHLGRLDGDRADQHRLPLLVQRPRSR